jgi:hypothetical protein
MSARSVIYSIAKGAEKLIAENRQLRRDVEKLEAARYRLKEENLRLKEEGARMERKLAVKELVGGFAGAGGAEGTTRRDGHDNKVARARVNRLLREVDKCMALISKE